MTAKSKETEVILDVIPKEGDVIQPTNFKEGDVIQPITKPIKDGPKGLSPEKLFNTRQEIDQLNENLSKAKVILRKAEATKKSIENDLESANVRVAHAAKILEILESQIEAKQPIINAEKAKLVNIVFGQDPLIVTIMDAIQECNVIGTKSSGNVQLLLKDLLKLLRNEGETSVILEVTNKLSAIYKENRIKGSGTAASLAAINTVRLSLTEIFNLLIEQKHSARIWTKAPVVPDPPPANTH